MEWEWGWAKVEPKTDAVAIGEAGRRRRCALAVLVALVLSVLASTGIALAAGSGYDISFPECSQGYPVANAPNGAMIVGVNGGRAFTPNPCLAAEYRWAGATGRTPALYMNINSPSGPGLDQAGHGPRGACAPADAACRAYNYGYNAAAYADRYARAQSTNSPQWWLDVETDNYWSWDTGLNAQVIQGAIDYLHSRKLSVGIYSVRSMWLRIAGAYAPRLPTWVPQMAAWVPTLAYCSADYSFGGGPVVMVQRWDGYHDLDFPCPGAVLPAPFPPAPLPVPSLAPAGPIPLAGPIQSTLAGSAGGTTVDYALKYPGGNAPRTVTLDFWAHGPDVANALFVTVYAGGTEVAKVRGTDTATPGHLTVTFSTPNAGPVDVHLTDYLQSSTTPRIGYALRAS